MIVTKNQPARSIVRLVELKTSTQPPVKSPSGFTSLMRSGGGDTVILNRPTLPSAVATISVFPLAFGRITPSDVIVATSGNVELQLTVAAGIGAPNTSRAI